MNLEQISQVRVSIKSEVLVRALSSSAEGEPKATPYIIQV